MTAPVATRLARLDDVAALAALLGAMERLYRPDRTWPAGHLEARLREALFGARPTAEALLATRGGALVGFAFFSPFFPTVGGGSGALLKDVFVDAASRRLGVGRALLAALARETLARGWDRIEFATGTDNAEAQAVYAALGAPRHEHAAYRVAGNALARLAAQS